ACLRTAGPVGCSLFFKSFPAKNLVAHFAFQMTVRGPRLGELLERRGTLSREQLLRALRHQKVVGGKLGTCLLEIDALAEDELLRALGEQHGVPFAAPDDLRNVAADVRTVVPA